MMQECIFCKIANHEIPAKIIYEDELVLAFDDLEPQAPTHFLVVPKQHIESALALTETEASLVGHCYAVIAKLAVQNGFGSYRVITNCGASAGQSVLHLHFHVLAGRDMAWPPG